MSEKPQLNIAANAKVVIDATLEGKISIGAGTVVHPQAVLKAGEGEIRIGSYNIIEEGVVIENKGPPGSVLEIGDENVFKVRTKCWAKSIGNHNMFGVYSIIGEGTEISDMCTICPYGEYRITYEPLAPRTVIYNGEFDRRLTSETPNSTKLQVEALNKVLTGFHRSYKVKSDSSKA